MNVRVLAAGIVTAALAIDQLSKIWAVNALAEGRTIPVLPTVELDLAYNSGFSFSTASGYGQLIGAAGIAVSFFLARVIARETQLLRGGLLAVMLAGALGNLCDRLVRATDGVLSGAVVDFIDVSWFAVFNIADICIVGGTVLFAVTEVASSRNDQRSAADEVTAGVGRPEHADLEPDRRQEPLPNSS